MSKIVVGKKFGRTKIRNWFAVAYNRNNRDEVIREFEEDDIDHENSLDCWD